MGACCGKPDRKSQGYVLGGINNSTTPAPQTTASSTPATKPTINTKAATAQRHTSGGQTLGGSSPPPPPQSPNELSAAAKAALKRAEQNERRGAPNDGKLSRELAKKNKETNKDILQQSTELDQLPKRDEWN